VSILLLSFHIQSSRSLQKDRDECKNDNSYENYTMAVFNGLFTVPGRLNNGMMKYSCPVIFNKEAFFTQMNKDEISRQQADSTRWSTLMARAQVGCESDYRQLLTELANVIHAYLRKRVGNQHFLEDCVQESLLAIHQARHTYDPQRPFRPWLFTIVRHKLIDYLRHKTACQRIVERHQQAEDIRNQGAQPNMVEGGIDNINLLKALPIQNREALTRTKLLGFTCAETAKQLGISESAVKVRVHRAINKLKQILEDEE
jgi:RNA polymerase sigma-70 factor (ECF subfamily)